MSEHDDWDIDPRTDDFYVNSEQHGYDRNDVTPPSSSGNPILMFPLYIFIVFSGVFILAFFCQILGIDAKDVPVILTLILWFVFSMLTAALVAFISNLFKK